MIFIIGGFAQGKLRFAKGLINSKEQAEYAGSDFAKIFEQKIINKLHIIIKDLINAAIDPIEFFQDNMHLLRDKIIICDEIGLGVVPIDDGERNWRELTGRVCCIIAQEADEVYRVYSGIPTRLKGKP